MKNAAPKKRNAARAAAAPEVKISETLVSFVRPLLEALGPAGEHATRELFAIGISVWNAHVRAMPAWGSDSSALERVAAHLRDPQAPLHHGTYFAALSERRRVTFADDARFVTKWELTLAPGMPFALSCAAAVPAKPAR